MGRITCDHFWDIWECDLCRYLSWKENKWYFKSKNGYAWKIKIIIWNFFGLIYKLKMVSHEVFKDLHFHDELRCVRRPPHKNAHLTSTDLTNRLLKKSVPLGMKSTQKTWAWMHNVFRGEILYQQQRVTQKNDHQQQSQDSRRQNWFKVKSSDKLI